jgi:hypothetical protein
MTYKETLKAIALIQECYPHFMDGRTPDTTAAIWAKMFPSEEYLRVEAAIMAFVASDVKGFPPAIGQIKEKLAQMDADNTLDEAGAWTLVAHAMRNGLYGSEKEFAKLPYDIQKSVGSASQLREWAMMDTEVVNSVVCSNFMRSYRARSVHTREMQKLPESAKQFYVTAGEAFAFDRALPAPDKPQEAEVEPVECPEEIKGIADAMRKKADQDKIAKAKRTVSAMMRGIAGGEFSG